MLAGHQVSDTPSAEWTNEERMSVAAHLADHLGEISKGHFVEPNLLQDIVERIKYVLVMPPDFLEANRKSIIEGQIHPSNPNRKER